MKKIQLDSPRATAIPNHFKIDIKPAVGQGEIDIYCFASGLKLMISETQFEQSVLLQGFSARPFVGFGFCLAGQFESRPVCFNEPLVVKTGESGFFAFPRAIEFIEKSGKKKMHRVYLMLEGDSLAKLTQGDEDRFAPVLRSLDRRPFCRIADTMTPVIKMALQQLIYCPYYGATRQFFMEGKAMELLAHKLEQLHTLGRDPGEPSLTNTRDIERVRHAADLLINNLENPPDMTTLAHAVGLGRTKFYQCFRHVFGLSPFDYLRNHRLQTAKFLLQEGAVNVTEAALSVGYGHLSYFAKSFKSMYGVSPKEFLEASRSLISNT